MARPKILNVDDEEAGRFAVSRMLESDGFVVEEAGSGTEALEKLETFVPDIVLLDVNLPDLDGFEVCRRIKRNPKTSNVTVVHLSASFVAPSDKVLGLEMGADGYLTEPLTQHELLATMRAFLRMRRTEAVQRFMASITQLLSASLEENEVLSRFARHVVPFLGDACLVQKLDDDAICTVALAHAHGDAEAELVLEAAMLRPPEAPLDHGVSRVIETATPELFPPALSDLSTAQPVGDDHPFVLRKLGARSYMCVPLVARGRTLGAITIASLDPARRYGVEDLALAVDLVGRCSLLVDNARSYDTARRAITARENMLSVVSHDLKNPLQSVLMNVARALNYLPADDKGARIRKHLSSIQRASERMDRLIHDLLDLSAMEAGKLSMEHRPIDAHDLIAAAVEMFEPAAMERDLSLTMEVGDLKPVRCDEHRIVQVLSNVIGNAIKFTPRGGSIVVRAQPGRGCVVFSVSDTGPGIPSAQIPQLFDRFWHATRTAREGTGLGLCIAKGIVEEHGGTIDVETEEGRGSTFRFTVPLDQNGATHFDDAADAQN